MEHHSQTENKQNTKRKRQDMAGHGRTLERFERFPGFPELPMTIQYSVLRFCPLQEALAWNRNQQEPTGTNRN